MSTDINLQMKLAAANAIAALAKEPVTDQVKQAAPDREFEFGPDYFMPIPLDSRLLEEVSSAVAAAARDSKVAGKPIKNIDEYKGYLKSLNANNTQA